MKTKYVTADPAHEALFNALCHAVRDTAPNMPSDEVLAVASNFVGKMIAVQDQTKITPEMAMMLVSENIQKGNQQMIETLMNASGPTNTH